MTLRQAAFSAARWTTAAAVTRSVLQVAQVAVLTRLLVPEDYGLMAIVISVMGFATIVSDLGVSSAIIQKQDTTDAQYSTLYWVNVLCGVGVMMLVAVVSPLVAAVYGDARLVPLLIATSVSFPVIAIGHQLKVRAEKDLRFGALARIEIISFLIAFGVAIWMAWNGLGVAALVGSLLVNSLVGTVLAWALLARGWRPFPIWQLSEVREYLSFGAYMVGNNIANTINSVADMLIGGRILGPAALGLYSVPRNLSLQVQWLLNPIVTRIAFPVMSRVQDDRARLRRIYLQVLRLTASVNAPIYAFIALFAPEITGVLFGSRWVDSAELLRILAIWGFLRSTGNPVGALVLAVGRARLSFQWNLAVMAFVPLLLWQGSLHFGLAGLAGAWVAFGVVGYIPNWYFLVRSTCGARLLEYTAQLIIPAALAAAAGGVAWLAVSGLDGLLLRLVVGGAAGGVTYLGASYAFNRPWIDAMRTLLAGERIGPPTQAASGVGGGRG
jgi:O-antigen/teichoic acid export membrane protein